LPATTHHLPAFPTRRSSDLLGRAAIEPAFRQGRQLLVRRFLLIESLLQHAGAVVPAKEPSPGDQAAVAGDLVVLDGLRSGNERGDRKSTRLNSSHQIISYAV